MSIYQFLALFFAAVILGPFLVYAFFKMAALGIFRAKRIMEQEKKQDDELPRSEETDTRAS